MRTAALAIVGARDSERRRAASRTGTCVTIGHRESLAAELRRRATSLLCGQVMSLPPGQVNLPEEREAADLIDRVQNRCSTRVHSANENILPDVPFDRIDASGGPVGTASMRRSG